MTQPFIIYALPRSRTTWLSKFLSFGLWECRHDILAECPSIDGITEYLRQPHHGIIDTGLAIGWKAMRKLVPDANIVVIRRDPFEVKSSLNRLGLDVNIVDTLDRKLKNIEELKDILFINYNELSDRTFCNLLFEYCLNQPLPDAWWNKWKNQKIEVDVKKEKESKYKYIKENIDKYEKLFSLFSSYDNFNKLDYKADTGLLLRQLDAHPELWDMHTERKTFDGSPHSQMSDIWVRFRRREELKEVKNYNEAFIPVWYPCRQLVSEAERISMEIMKLVNAVQLGGVLITKIPPGCGIAPHHDRGRWHSEFFNCKVYVPIKSNSGCLNKCEKDVITMKAGEAWTFDNLKVHSVENKGNDDRITLIISMRVE